MTTVHQRINHCLVLANPSAGLAARAFGQDVADRCVASCLSVETRMTATAGDAARIVAETVGAAAGVRPHLIVAVGGDGTARETAEALARALGRWPAGGAAVTAPGIDGGSGLDADVAVPALLVLPAGTGNSTYRALWGERDWAAVLTAVLRGDAQVRHLDLARIVACDHAALLGASTGLIAQVTELASQLTEIPGRERYHQALGSVLASPTSYDGRVLVDGEEVHSGQTTMVTVGGGKHRAGIFEVLPQSVLDDGLLDVCVVAGGLDEATRTELAPLVMTGRHIGHPAVRYVKARQVTIERTDGEQLCFEYDGDVVTDPGTAVTLEVVPAAVPAFAAR
jgi:diacylglycerol kinase (ATP)